MPSQDYRAALTASGVTAIALAMAIACSNSSGPNLSGLPSCSSTTLLTNTPMALGDINYISPLGNLNPPGHTFPTDHIYFYAKAGPAVAIVSPGAIRVTQALLQKRTGNGQPELDDYGLDFYACTSQHFYFAHFASLTSSLLSRLGSLSGSCNSPYSTGGYTYQQCRKDVSVDLAAGDSIGTAGGPTEGALDLGLIDADSPPLAYVDPGRQTGAGGLHAACPLDKFASPTKDSLFAHVDRTIPPLCGTVMQDVANTTQGRWFFDATAQEDHHLSLVHQNNDPTTGAFSIGTQLTGLGPTVVMFAPSTTGRINRDFNLVTADGKIYCYEASNWTGHLFTQLVSGSTLKIEAVPGVVTCGDSTVWTFSANAVSYAR